MTEQIDQGFHKKYLDSKKEESKKELKNLLLVYLGILIGAWVVFNMFMSMLLDFSK